MSKKKTCVVLAAIASLGVVFACMAASPNIASLLGSGNQDIELAMHFTSAKNKLYAGAENPDGCPALSGNALTELGNPISFSYKGLTNPADHWQTITPYGYIMNTAQIGAMESLTIKRKSETSSLRVYWSSGPITLDAQDLPTTDDGRMATFEKGTEMEMTFDFHNEKPNYFSVIADDEGAEIASMSLSFLCSNVYRKLEIDYNEEYGSVSGAGYRNWNEPVDVTATPNPGYRLVGWYQGDTLLSNDLTYTFNLASGTSPYKIEAKFGPAFNPYSPYFGMYPQTKLYDDLSGHPADFYQIQVLRDLLPNHRRVPEEGQESVTVWKSYNFFNGDGVRSHYMWYADIEDGGSLFRAVYYTSYRSSNVAGRPSQAENGYEKGNIHWFRWEPIRWDVLDATSEPGKALVLAHDILDAQEFYHEEHAGTREVTGVDPVTGETWSDSGIYPNNYKYSDLRRYANTDFFNTAFTEDQKTDVAVSTIDNSEATTEYHTNDYACSNTQDRIFPLSHREACNADYGFVDDSGRTTTREKRATDYAKCLGILVNANGNSNWWTRSPSCSYADYVSECDYSGYLQGNRVVSCGVGLLPAARFYLG